MNSNLDTLSNNLNLDLNEMNKPSQDDDLISNVSSKDSKNSKSSNSKKKFPKIKKKTN